MKIVILTNEYPPNVYGGAGVHVEYLTRELAKLDGREHEIEVLCFGDQDVEDQNLKVRGVKPDFELPHQDDRHAKFLDTMARDLIMAGSIADADIVHGHTWYSHLAGCLAKQLTGAKLVLTTHSLEPHRPWKVEQLGTAYHASSWVERTAYENADGIIAVSGAMNEDVRSLYDVSEDSVRTIYNGIDVGQYSPTPDEEVLKQYDIDPDQPYVLFVGRITRQKGILHLVRAIHHMDSGVQVVLCAGAPDTEDIGKEMEALVDEVKAETDNRIVWLAEMLPRADVITLYTHAAVFVCPSVYEPFGIINLEAMACHTPVVASAVGGIPEIIVDDETGILVPFETEGGDSHEPRDPTQFARDLADGVNRLMKDPDRRTAMADAARTRVEEVFSWQAIAQQTLSFYKDLASSDDT
ncbi:glycogen synthase [Longibacter salinarum]|uniref:Glycogen synthase n=1 Tax=Longibacter salinarum TaxID=1850348 RepID=A0A2A8CVR7_9BACT|nr:glycogen synthase [Longibacter salinarum]PEN12782.1 glycogen synthase [Longibacter salinarum]